MLVGVLGCAAPVTPGDVAVVPGEGVVGETGGDAEPPVTLGDGDAGGGAGGVGVPAGDGTVADCGATTSNTRRWVAGT